MLASCLRPSQDLLFITKKPMFSTKIMKIAKIRHQNSIYFDFEFPFIHHIQNCIFLVWLAYVVTGSFNSNAWSAELKFRSAKLRRFRFLSPISKLTYHRSLLGSMDYLISPLLCCINCISLSLHKSRLLLYWLIQ